MLQSVSRGITDIGVMAPPDCQDFFTKCGFGPDRQDLGSQAMAIQPEVWTTKEKPSAAALEGVSSEQPQAFNGAFVPGTDMLSSRIQSCLDDTLQAHSFQVRRSGQVWYVPSRHKVRMPS